MRRISIILTFVAMLTLVACTQNNGHIGHWFGQWKVERITIDGVDSPDYKNNCFFCFQNGVFGVRHSSGGTVYGQWKDAEQENVITVDFDVAYHAPSATWHVYLDDHVTFTLLSHNGKKKVLEQVKDDGKTYTYYLTKW